MTIPLTINGATFEYPENFDEQWGVNATEWAQAVTNGMLQMAGGNFPLTADVNFGPNFGLLSKYFETRSANPSTIGTVRLSSADLGVGWRNNANSGNLILTTDASDNLLFNGHAISNSTTGTVTSIIGTADQVIASSPAGNVTLSLPQSIGTSSSPTFASETLTGHLTVSTSGIVVQDSQMSPSTVTITVPATLSSTWTLKLPIDDGLPGQIFSTDGSGNASWINASGGGTINSGLSNQLAYYAANGTTLSGLTAITASRALASNASGLPVASTTTATELGFVSGVTSAIQTQLGTKIDTAGTALSKSGTTLNVTSNAITGSTANSGGSAGLIAQGTVSTPDLRANAVTQTTTGTTSVTLTTGGFPVLVTMQIDESALAAAGVGSFNGVDMSFTITRDGSTTVYSARQFVGGATVGKGMCFSFCGSTLDTPAAGSHTWVAAVSVGTGTSAAQINASAFAIEMKR